MAKNKDNLKERSGAEYYSKLIIYRGRQISLAITVAGFIAFFTIMIFQGMISKKSWLVLMIPVAICGITLVLIPSTEEWEYKHWQSTAEKQEQIFFR